MNRFWQSILLSAGNFTGNPMMKHLAIPTIGQEHFQQWLRLFYQTLHAIAPSPEAVAHVGAKARMIAESLLTGIWVHRDKGDPLRSEEHTSELQSLMRISYAVFCLKK